MKETVITHFLCFFTFSDNSRNCTPPPKKQATAPIPAKFKQLWLDMWAKNQPKLLEFGGGRLRISFQPLRADGPSGSDAPVHSVHPLLPREHMTKILQCIQCTQYPPTPAPTNPVVRSQESCSAFSASPFPHHAQLKSLQAAPNSAPWNFSSKKNETFFEKKNAAFLSNYHKFINCFLLFLTLRNSFKSIFRKSKKKYVFSKILNKNQEN